jgi:prepilin-type N-terminal cleavage/methylation domain-containing protein
MRGLESQRRLRGFTMLELLITMTIGVILAVIAIPVLGSALQRMHLSSMTSSVSTGILKARYEAIRDSQTYTLTITTPANTYVVKNVQTGAAGPTIPLPPEVALNGGVANTFTYTLCPNGIVYGASGGTCVPGNPNPPLLKATVAGAEVDISVSSVGNVTTTNIK